MSTNGQKFESWGRLPKAEHRIWQPASRHDALPELNGSGPALPFGLGRSYGDSCLNDQGSLLVTRSLDRFIEFDAATGMLSCEAGVSLAEILDLIVPCGYFLPVTPGTRFVTVGGAMANDIHGKNHHRSGSFGHHVLSFELLRTDGQRLSCSPDENADWFRATIGGLGLTGLITRATFQLKPIHNPFIQVEHVKFGNLDRFFELARESDANFEYTVAWVDCLARGKKLGRGIFMRGNHAAPQLNRRPKSKVRTFSVPCNAPGFLLNQYTIGLFNQLFYHKQRREREDHTLHYEPFFYPLDSVLKWNKLYGSRGFFQYQCVVPIDQGADPIREILGEISSSRQASFLAVLKVFGNQSAPGMLSFPRPGVTLALDFPNKGKKTRALLDRLDEITRQAGGCVYPAKDARMTADSFASYFPNWRELEPFMDPGFSSSFWRRVTPS